MRAPQNADELSRLPGMSLNQMQRHCNQLLQAVQRGLKAEPITHRARPPDETHVPPGRPVEWRKVTLMRWACLGRACQAI
jgi:hypothetical protein